MVLCPIRPLSVLLERGRTCSLTKVTWPSMWVHCTRTHQHVYTQLVVTNVQGAASVCRVARPAEAAMATGVLLPVIHQAALDCIAAFRSCIAATSRYEFEDQMGRFKLWAINIDVFSSSRRSLDGRLKNNVSTRNMVLQLLRALQLNLDYGK